MSFYSRSGEELKYQCPRAPPCPKPFEVKFSGFMYFSYISIYERTTLASEKFNGVQTDCQDNECTFDLDTKSKRRKHFEFFSLHDTRVHWQAFIQTDT